MESRLESTNNLWGVQYHLLLLRSEPMLYDCALIVHSANQKSWLAIMFYLIYQQKEKFTQFSQISNYLSTNIMD
jgi:hypothetical protein